MNFAEGTGGAGLTPPEGGLGSGRAEVVAVGRTDSAEPAGAAPVGISGVVDDALVAGSALVTGATLGRFVAGGATAEATGRAAGPLGT